MLPIRNRGNNDDVDLFVFIRVWNEAVAHRLSTMGHSVTQGDLVVQTEQKKLDDAAQSSSPQVRKVRNRKAHLVLSVL